MRDATAGRHAPTPAPPAERPALLHHAGPNWFTPAMGTGIVAIAAVLLPGAPAALRDAATAVWAAGAALLVGALVATIAQWRRHPHRARAHALDPAMAPFYGAPPMALSVVAAGCLLCGAPLLGHHAAVAVAAVLWVAGTVAGLAVSVAIPVLMFTRHDLRPETTAGTWLLPVVPPLVAATAGAGLIAHLPAGQARLTLLLTCYAMLGMSMIAALVTITLIWSRLAYHGPGAAVAVPTLWIVLGPLGSSIAAANLLGDAAPTAIGAPYASALHAFGVVYGVPVLGFALLWLAIAAAVTARAARRHLPFTLSWWSFTFPVGTCVIGAATLASHTGDDALAVLAWALGGLLVGAWATVAIRTTRGAIRAVLRAA